MEGLISSSPLGIVLAEVHLYSPLISDIVAKNFVVHLRLKDKSSKIFRPFSRKEQFTIHLAIQGLDEATKSLFSEGVVLSHPLVYVLLDGLGYPVRKLAIPPAETEKLAIYLEYPNFDMLLTLAKIVRLMSSQESELFDRVISSSGSRFKFSIVSICDTLTKKYRRGDLDMNDMLKWLKESKCSKYEIYIFKYFERCIDTEAKHKALERGMQEGYVSFNYIKIVICGPPCVGKTAFKNLLANRPPPFSHHSTPIAARPVHAIERIAAGGKVWKEITEEDLLKMLSNIIRETEEPAEVEAPILSPIEVSLSPARVLPFSSKKPASFTSVTTSPPSNIPSLPAPLVCQFTSSLPSNVSLSSPVVLRSSSSSPSTLSPGPLESQFFSTSSLVAKDELPDFYSHKATNSTSELKKDFDYASRKIIEQLSSEKKEGSQKLHTDTWIHLLDSGGQPQFTDLLRMFVRGNSLYIIVMKVTESLHDKPTFVYSINGKALNTPKEMTMTNLQIIENHVRSVAATSREGTSKPAFAIVATHCDKQSFFMQKFRGKETIEKKNEIILSHLSDFVDFFVFYNRDANELIFPVNNLCQKNRETISAEIRHRLVSDITFNINIPIRWYVFDLNMKNEASKETHGMISLESCYSIGQRLEMDKEEVKKCLIYLDSMRLCIYYPKDLDHVVFTNPQFLIDCLSKIACVSFVDDLKQILPEGVSLSKEMIHLLKCKGTFNKALLHSLESTLKFVPGLFSIDNLLTLLRHLLVISTIRGAQDVKYFIPILLLAEQKQKSFFAKSAKSDPLLITFNNKLILQARD